jgi:type IV pilus assembly protein PilY1
MEKTAFRLVSQPFALVLFMAAGRAEGQVDVNPPRPNVLLLVDSSGSMEYKTGTTDLPKCYEKGDGTSEKSRWINLVEVLTGRVNDSKYRCQTILRNSSAFQNQYLIAGAAPTDKLNPRDYLYPIPYHRPMSGDCTPMPGSNNDSIAFCPYTVTSCDPATCKAQNPDSGWDASNGLLDSFAGEIRFGLMTFDTLPSEKTDMVGTWSYVVGAMATGAPADCVSGPSPQEVGARNALAPLWEGRLVSFGSPIGDNESAMLRTNNQKIQNVLLATRPFGATPIAGMLRDAQDFFWNDPDPDGSHDVAPKNDPYAKCRDNFIVLLTDGEPNMDLRRRDASQKAICEGVPNCLKTGTGDLDACCPFKKPERYAWEMANDPAHPVIKTYVIGFAVTTGTDEHGTVVPCTSLTDDDLLLPSGRCNQTKISSSLQACCTLNRIASNGGTTKAYFADKYEDLGAALAEVLSNAAKGTTSRTLPVFASGSGSSAGSATFRFFTSFTPKIDGTGLWQGVIERQRYECKSGELDPKASAVDKGSGDDFVNNVNTKGATNRTFYTVVAADAVGTTKESTHTIRTQPSLANKDGASAYTGAQIVGDTASFPKKTDLTAAMALTSASCSAANADTCRERYLTWLVGGNNGTGYSRCTTTSGITSCNLIADIFHSVPAVVGTPRESLRDEGYQAFALGNARKRPIVLYTSTNDGMLHAFKVASNDPTDTTPEAKVLAPTNNELWAFIPPAVLPKIPDEYPNMHQVLLDGAPVVRDVAGTVPTGGATILLERDLKTIGSSGADWRTVLVQSFGGIIKAEKGGNGYFALDVTDPVAGPQFLWQLTTDAAGQPLFGETGGTPTIATLFFDPDPNGDGSGAREIPVALLPGGDGGALPKLGATDSGCNRAVDPDPVAFDDALKPRGQVPCYEDDASTTNRAAARRGRSLTVVRLDTGEIIRTFRRSKDDAPVSIAGRVTESPLDSPITGQPVAYPGWTGAIADRAYVGDRDGTLWRIDLSSTLPKSWTMKLFLDAYHSSSDYRIGQPIATTPVVSTNDNGQVVVLFSTGSQDDLVGTPQSQNFVYSLYEQTSTTFGATIAPQVNWYLWFKDATAGKRVTGPMTLFSSNVYFSTYTPPTIARGCDAGSSSIWGMNFVTKQDSGDAAKGGKAALPKDGKSTSTDLVQEIVPDDTLIAKGSTIFGVGLAQVQGCFVTDDAIPDPFFGGSYNPIAASSSPKYQLVVQTGRSGDTTKTGGATNSATIDLPQPDASPRINSWAMVIE